MPPISTVKPSDPKYNSTTLLFSSSFKAPLPKSQPNPLSSKQSNSSVLQNLETHLGGELPKNQSFGATTEAQSVASEVTSTSSPKTNIQSESQPISSPHHSEISTEPTSEPPQNSLLKPVSEAPPASEDKANPSSETAPETNPNTTNVIIPDASEANLSSETPPPFTHDSADAMQEASEAENQMNAPNPESEHNISSEHEEI